MGYGIKISLPGKDVNDPTVDLALSSEYVNPMIQVNTTPPHFDYESFTYTSNPGLGTTNLVSIPHGYDYIPANLSLLSFDQENFFIGSRVNTDLATYEDRYQIYCDNTDLKIDLERVSLFGGSGPVLTGTTVYYKYYIFVMDGI